MIKYLISILITFSIWQPTKGQKTSVEKEFPQTIADESLRLNKSYFHYKKVNHNEIKKDSIIIFNDSNIALELDLSKAPSYIKLFQVPKSLLPGEKGKIDIIFDASKKIDAKGNIRLGKDYKRIPISIKGKENLRNSRTDFITIRSFIEEDFSHLSKKELKKAPKAVFDTIEYNFGKVAQGTVIIHDFIVKNEGKDDLDIRYAKGCWGCYVIGKTDSTISKGNEGFIKAKFDTRRRRGKQVKSITVLTNDPKNSHIILKLIGEITAPQTSRTKEKKTIKKSS